MLASRTRARATPSRAAGRRSVVGHASRRRSPTHRPSLTRSGRPTLSPGLTTSALPSRRADPTPSWSERFPRGAERPAWPGQWLPELVQVQQPEVDPVEHHRTMLRIHEPEQEGHQGGLARAARAHHRHRLAGGDAQVDGIDGWDGRAWIGVGHAPQCQPRPSPRRAGPETRGARRWGWHPAARPVARRRPWLRTRCCPASPCREPDRRAGPCTR